MTRLVGVSRREPVLVAGYKGHRVVTWTRLDSGLFFFVAACGAKSYDQCRPVLKRDDTAGCPRCFPPALGRAA